MIEGVREIVTDNPTRELWKMLRLFLNCGRVEDMIRKTHAISEGRFRADVHKQAVQVGYCVRQAEEYFRASGEVGLPTRPTLMYYGAASLSRALVLLRLSGEYSIDALRKQRKHNHHGLDFIGSGTRQSKSAEGFLRAIRFQCHLKDGAPWGHVPLVYRSLAPTAIRLKAEIHLSDVPVGLTQELAQDSADLPPLGDFASSAVSLFEIVRTLPDMYFHLLSMGITPALYRGSFRIDVNQTMAQVDARRELERTSETYHFFVDGLLDDQKVTFLEWYRSKNDQMQIVADLGAHVHFTISRNWAKDEVRPTFYFPDLVDDINDRKFYLIPQERHMPEPVAHLATLFCLAWMARYQPDQWMRTIDTQVETAELIDSLLNLVARKFPNLLLDQMTGVKHYVHL
jgi:hypothetical protein